MVRGATGNWLGKLMRLGGTPHGIAGGFALGVGLSLVPLPFAGMVLALALAPVLRLSPPATYLGTAVVNPLTGSAFYFGELWLGLWLTQRPTPSWSEAKALDATQWLALAREALVPFAVGAAISIAVLSSLAYAAVFFATRRWQARRRAHAQHDGKEGRAPKHPPSP